MSPSRHRSRFASWISGILLVLATIAFLGPLWFMLAGNLRKNEKVLTLGWQALLPSDATVENYRAVFRQLDFTHFFLNSLLIVGLVVVAGLLVNSMAGYARAFEVARARSRARGGDRAPDHSLRSHRRAALFRDDLRWLHEFFPRADRPVHR